MIEAGLVAARFLHFAAAAALFGLALFPLYSFPNRGHKPPASVRGWLRNVLRWAAVLALLSNLLWGLFTVANMVGTLNAVANPDTLLSIGFETGFGQVWVARLALAVTLLALLVGRRQRHGIILVVAAALLASLALVGHTQSNEGWLRVIHMTVDSAHLLGAGAWLGGLIALGYLLTLTRRNPSPGLTADITTALICFTGMGYTAVGVLIGTGLINTWILVGSVAKLATTSYGQMLLVKLCLLAGMLVLAALNRFRLVPRLLKENRQQAASWLNRLRRNVLSEQALGLSIVLIVSALGTMEPASGVSR